MSTMIPVEYVLASKAFVYQIQHRTDTLARLKSMGFIKFRKGRPENLKGRCTHDSHNDKRVSTRRPKAIWWRTPPYAGVGRLGERGKPQAWILLHLATAYWCDRNGSRSCGSSPSWIIQNCLRFSN